jgi:Protein of unknown function, DUF488
MSKHPLPQERDWPKDAIFTVGHSTLPLEEFIALLDTYGIETLADIRTMPRSRHNPQFNGDTLGTALRPSKINYVPLRALGGLRHARKDSPNGGWRNTSFRGYAPKPPRCRKISHAAAGSPCGSRARDEVNLCRALEIAGSAARQGDRLMAINATMGCQLYRHFDANGLLLYAGQRSAAGIGMRRDCSGQSQPRQRA